MECIDITVSGAQYLDEILDVTEEAVVEARCGGVPVQINQTRGLLDPVISIVVGQVLEQVMKPFVQKLVQRICDSLSGRASNGSEVAPFRLVIDGEIYELPAEMERLRAEQGGRS